tara:strand:- start:950 stop:1084 length:135 start_codon:yes stop_codon:yes gene_type:complete
VQFLDSDAKTEDYFGHALFAIGKSVFLGGDFETLRVWGAFLAKG